MEKTLKQGSIEHQAAENGREIESGVQRKAWRRPVVTRIDIKRTMLIAGSAPDNVVCTT